MITVKTVTGRQMGPEPSGKRGHQTSGETPPAERRRLGSTGSNVNCDIEPLDPVSVGQPALPVAEPQASTATPTASLIDGGAAAADVELRSLICCACRAHGDCNAAR